MKAAVIHEYGGPQVLKYEDYPDPVVGTGDVLVRVTAASINPVDTFERAGLTKDYRPVRFPGVLGWDLAGTVVTVGEGVDEFSVGDRVLAWAYHTYAELCVVKASLLAKVPQGMELDVAASLPLVTLTGSQLISVASGAKAGQTVLVSGALGAVGRAATFTAKELGAVVIAGVRGRQLEAAQDIGADRVIALDDESALDALEPVDVVANTVRGRTAQQILGKVRPGGVFASVTGAPAGAQDYPSIRVVAFVSKQDAKALQHLAQSAAAGKFNIPIDRRLPLKDAAVGHATVEQGGTGKVLLLP